jgi:hypothetical protein
MPDGAGKVGQTPIEGIDGWGIPGQGLSGNPGGGLQCQPQGDFPVPLKTWRDTGMRT